MVNTLISDCFPMKNSIHGSPYGKLINDTIGLFFEDFEEKIQEKQDGCFINTANGKYLDLWGKDYDLKRNNGETDEDYRKRLMEKMRDRFTFKTLYELYVPQLLVAEESSIFQKMKLYSDNVLVPDGYAYFIDLDEETYDFICTNWLLYDNLYRLIINEDSDEENTEEEEDTGK